MFEWYIYASKAAENKLRKLNHPWCTSTQVVFFSRLLVEPTILHLHKWKSRRLHTVAPSWHGHSIPYWYARTIMTDCWGAVKDAGRWYGWPIWLPVSTSLCALQIWPWFRCWQYSIHGKPIGVSSEQIIGAACCHWQYFTKGCCKILH